MSGGIILEENEVVERIMSGALSVYHDYKKAGDAGTWTVTNKRMHFKFMGITRYEDNIYFEDIVSIRKSRRLGFYEFVVISGSRSDDGSNVKLVSMRGMKDFLDKLLPIIGEEKLLPTSKGFYVTACFYGGLLVFLGIMLLIIMYNGFLYG